MTFRISRWFKGVGGNKAIKEKSRSRLQGVCHSITKAFLLVKRKPLFSLSDYCLYLNFHTNLWHHLA